MTAAETLQKRAARLTTRQTHRFARESGEIERITLEPVLAILEAQTGSSSTLTGSSSGSPKSKPPIAVDAFDLLREIDDFVADACREYGLAVRFTRPPILDVIARALMPAGAVAPGARERAAGSRVVSALRAAGYRMQVDPDSTAHRDIVGNLRQLVPALLADAKGDPDDELLVYWSDLLGTWATKAEASIGDREEGSSLIPLPMTCPDCQTEKVTRIEEGETFREPALVAAVHRHEVQSITCRACETVWRRGNDLDSVVFDVLRDPTAHARTDALGYDLALGYAPPMFTSSVYAQRVERALMQPVYNEGSTTFIDAAASA